MTIKNFGDLEPGDVILGGDGEPVTVVQAYEPHLPETMWELELENGETIKASGNHLFYVETPWDWELHGLRRKVGRKAFRKLPKGTFELLERVAESPQEVETSLIDMVTLTQAAGDEAAVRALERIAESIGHVAENTDSYEDISTGELMEDPTIRTYDARRFAQQLLSLSSHRRYRRRWPLVVGKVVTTEQMVEMSESVEIPVLREA